MTSLAPTADEVAAALHEAGVPDTIDFETLLLVAPSPPVRWARSIADPAERAKFLVAYTGRALSIADRRWTEIDAIDAVLAVAQLDQPTFDLLAHHADEVMP